MVYDCWKTCVMVGAIDINNSFIDINNSFIDINNSFIDINKDGCCIHLY